ncbi:hypothetical protein FEA44_07425 [Mannheimia haemolytica]|uniref:Uncharacterized protein n=1 Tax=Mannheimia haemolytica TaxID=75985 RepID=A0A547AAR1_MANHA|nr:hypothetical protein FEB90_07585 [Mannheimia haemolytica]TRB34601.1 hypothetical protein FEB95_07640 [Mannheimia haemolytica]TRB37718.1 hypothetical protein FEB89_07155 [Mannheimia haemolytica]TRB44384.1 hypothetical protein FEA87_08425 [Mannheimia haemolytica]TRB48262.1 hypothetical protein FEB92_07325 [Mannheimia haemolytica]
MQNFSFSRPLVWVLIGLLGFLLLPSKALDYGLFDSTSDELLAAMGWACCSPLFSCQRLC